MAPWMTIVTAGVLAALSGWGVPAFFLRLFSPTLERTSASVLNYRGARVPLGLGVVWLVWGLTVAFASAIVTQTLMGVYLAFGPEFPAEASAGLAAISYPFGVVGMAGLLAAGAFLFGLIDDVYGSADKGFRGHLSALARGRLTTGALKMVGIGMLAFVAAYAVADVLPAVTASPGWLQTAITLARAVGVALVIVLSANLTNLLDLRPARALKGYLLLASAGVVATGLIAGEFLPEWVIAGPILVFGPVLVVWKHDASEMGMLGDAGANAMGVAAGFIIAQALADLPLALAVIVLGVLNVASERVSFSEVIARNRFLSWLDRLGVERPEYEDEPTDDARSLPRDDAANRLGSDAPDRLDSDV